MATTANKKTTSTSKSTEKTTTKQATTKAKSTEIKKVSDVAKQSVNAVPDGVNQNTIIVVKNGFHGKMVDESPKTHEIFMWDEFGDIQEMELGELRVAKNSSKTFFANNWFMFDEEYSWVIGYLGLNQYYTHAITEDGFEEILTKPADEIKEILSDMTDGQKNSLAYMVREKVAHGKIDSLKTIGVLEEGLGVELIDK